MTRLRNRIVLAACSIVSLICSAQSARADSFTYQLNAPVGGNGGTLGGTITFSGTAGDAIPTLSAASAFSLSYVPVAGATETWTQANPISATYNSGTDFGAAKLGDATIFAQTPVQGAWFWEVTNADNATVDLFWTPAPYGPNWAVSKSGPVDNNYAEWTLTLVPEPTVALVAAIPAILSLRRRRRTI